ncbi:MAG: hypothetical protein QXI19_14605 [Candidatus Caldarchaeum sp.]
MALAANRQPVLLLEQQLASPPAPIDVMAIYCFARISLEQVNTCTTLLALDPYLDSPQVQSL